MLIEAIFGVFSGLLSWFLEALPDWTFLTAQWYEQALTWWVDNVITLGFQMSTWLPIQAIGTVTQAYIAFVVIQFSITVLRLILSLFTGGGGSTR